MLRVSETVPSQKAPSASPVCCGRASIRPSRSPRSRSRPRSQPQPDVSRPRPDLKVGPTYPKVGPTYPKVGPTYLAHVPTNPVYTVPIRRTYVGPTFRSGPTSGKGQGTTSSPNRRTNRPHSRNGSTNS